MAYVRLKSLYKFNGQKVSEIDQNHEYCLGIIQQKPNTMARKILLKITTLYSTFDLF